MYYVYEKEPSSLKKLYFFKVMNLEKLGVNFKIDGSIYSFIYKTCLMYISKTQFDN